MTRLILVTDIRAPVDHCFVLSCDIDLHRRSMSASQEQAIAGVTHGPIGPGQQVTWQARHFGIQWRMTSKIVDYERPRRFVDQMQCGPFAAWRHEHRFEQHPTGTQVVDIAQYCLPFGPLGRVADLLFIRRYLRRLLENRNQHVKLEAEHPRRAVNSCAEPGLRHDRSSRSGPPHVTSGRGGLAVGVAIAFSLP